MFKKYTAIALTTAAICLGGMYAAKPMTIYWDGNTGWIKGAEITNPREVNAQLASALAHISQINMVGAKGYTLLEQPSRKNGNTGEMYIWW